MRLVGLRGVRVDLGGRAVIRQLVTGLIHALLYVAMTLGLGAFLCS